MQDAKNIVECLYQNSINKPNNIAYEFLTDLSGNTQAIKFAELYADVVSIAKSLLNKVGPGDCVLMLYPPGLEYIKTFFACVMAGIVAIPLYPPKKNKKSNKVFIVAEASKAKYALTTGTELHAIRDHWQQNCELPMNFVSTEELIDNAHNLDAYLPIIDKDKPAFLQYTSGSTGNPKGVIITQGNILANTRYLERLSGAHENDVFVNWLPLFHDLGLVTTILLPAYLGCQSILMAPATFVRSPAIWLKAMTQFGGTIGGAPDFAYDLCTDKISQTEMADLDLSNWRIAYNAAEPVKRQTLSRFAERFSTVGFNLDNFYPSYGMAESTAFISGGHGDDPLNSISISKSALSDHKVAFDVGVDEHKIDFVSNGKTDDLHQLKIVNPDSHDELPNGEIGEIWFSGPSVSPGYWLLDEASEQTFGHKLNADDEREYLRTGDLGFILDKHLYVTGRIKDMLIIKGKNYYPQDIESSIKYCHNDINPGHIAAFEVEGKLVLVTEVNRNALMSFEPAALVQEISRQIYTQHDLFVSDVVLLKPYKIPMTSSGKIRRRQTKELYLSGALESLFQKEQRTEKVKPAGDIEESVHDIWSQVLGSAQICVRRGFYELGGDSIKAVEIVSGVKKQFALVTLDENQLLECVSIRDMAQLVSVSLMKNAAFSNSEASTSSALNAEGVIRI